MGIIEDKRLTKRDAGVGHQYLKGFSDAASNFVTQGISALPKARSRNVGAKEAELILELGHYQNVVQTDQLTRKPEK